MLCQHHILYENVFILPLSPPVYSFCTVMFPCQLVSSRWFSFVVAYTCYHHDLLAKHNEFNSGYSALSEISIISIFVHPCICLSVLAKVVCNPRYLTVVPVITLDIFQAGVTSIRSRKGFMKTSQIITVTGQIHGHPYY